MLPSYLSNAGCSVAALWIAAASLAGCSRYHSQEYYAFYSYLDAPVTHCRNVNRLEAASLYSLCIYVDARHLDYSDNNAFLRSIAKHPSDRSKTRDVGHCWIYLEGIVDGQCVFVEGGHSGETGRCQARYLDGIMNYHDFGYANPTSKEMAECRFEPNPVKYLWEEQRDGFFEQGTGRHKPTFGVRIPLTEEQFGKIVCYIQRYNYTRYALTGNQCATYVAQIASLAGLDLDCETTIRIEPSLCFKGEVIRFWDDPAYSLLTIATPDSVERSLVEAVREGKAECVYSRYP